MSILIKGMNLDEDDKCRKCPFHHPSWLTECHPKYNCPVIQLPPHGDLVDKNHISELLDTDRHNRNIYQLVWNDAITTVIQKTPTIIEAEEE